MQRNRGKQQNDEDQKFLEDLIKFRDTKGTVNAKRGKIKDRNGIDLTEVENTKKMQKANEKRKNIPM